MVTWMSEIKYTVPRQIELQNKRYTGVSLDTYTSATAFYRSETLLGNVSISPE